MKRIGDTWVTELPNTDRTESWDHFWRHMSGEIARLRLAGQDASDND